MMKTIRLSAPQIDAVIEDLKHRNNIVLTPASYLKLKDIYDIFTCVRPGSEDENRHIWIEVERGPAEAFGDYEEIRESGEVKSPEEFEELWKDYFPDKTYWYKFETLKFRDEKSFFLNDILFGIINDKEPPSDNNLSVSEDFEIFIDWLRGRIISEVHKLKQNQTAYNEYIRNNLIYTKRFGKIRRKEFWDIPGDNAYRPDINLGEGIIEKLKAYIVSMKNEKRHFLNEMTANKYFRICEICYDANNYFKNQGALLTPREKYLKMADGRDAGLRSIDGDSAEAFYKWYHGTEIIGAHPWEICRGGNSTHISLYISEQMNKWDFYLAGSSIIRVEETVRMAVALYENGIPFQLRDMEEVFNMVTGNDFIGIVPDTICPVYCHSFFPKEDNIIDFMNLGSDKDMKPKIIEKAVWYPLEEISVI